MRLEQLIINLTNIIWNNRAANGPYSAPTYKYNITIYIYVIYGNQ